MRQRTNEEWRADLAATGPRRDEALADLRECVLRAARFYLCRQAPERARLDPEQVEALAEDAAQEATLAVLAKLDRFRGEAAFPTWASKFGVSAAAGLLRRREWAHVSLEALPDWGSSVATAAREVCDDPEAGARRREAWCLFREVVEEDLTAQQRTVLSLVFFHGLPPDEVAERLGISRGACYKAGHDMRRAIKRAIERRGWTSGELLAAFAAPAPRGAR